MGFPGIWIVDIHSDVQVFCTTIWERASSAMLVAAMVKLPPARHHLINNEVPGQLNRVDGG